MKLLLSVILFESLLYLTNGHGMVMSPPARGTRWRTDSSAPANYDDSSLYCGGFWAQWNVNGGKCGLCGDSYADATPRAHEIGGKFGQGVIVGTYSKGSTITVGVQLTANHAGYFYFYLCENSKYGENEACFLKNRLKTVDGSDKYVVPSTSAGLYNVNLQLPAGLTCTHCILQWTYNVGNSWGVCEDGSGAMGCGPQENFRTCSDISIV